LFGVGGKTRPGDLLQDFGKYLCVDALVIERRARFAFRLARAERSRHGGEAFVAPHQRSQQTVNVRLGLEVLLVIAHAGRHVERVTDADRGVARVRQLRQILRHRLVDARNLPLVRGNAKEYGRH
jgi:hypothetical protein